MAFKIVVLSCLLAIASAVTPRMSVGVSSLGLGNRVPFLGGRVVGGDDAEVGQFPHQVSLQWGSFGSFQHFCGGSIINERWILTAGHCVLAVPNYGSFVVKAGKHNIQVTEDSEQSVEVESTYYHEKYPGNVAPFDIALVKLKSPLKLNDRVKAIELPESNDEPTGDVILSGWGSISKSSYPIRPKFLQAVTIPIVEREACNKSIIAISHGTPSPLHNTNICTGPLSGGLGACKGDSGGPLISKSEDGTTKVVGVVSWGFVPCGAVGAPSVFVKVSDFVDWIKNHITEN